jgi:starvation-inducible DNA-binding protein
VERLRDAKRIVDAAGDIATSGLIDDWADQAEERAWFLFASTREG